jgi:hypothetical protein
LREDVAFSDILTLGERDPVELAIDADFHGHSIERLHRADPGQPYRDIPGLGLPFGDRHSRCGGRSSGSSGPRRVVGGNTRPKSCRPGTNQSDE